MNVAILLDESYPFGMACTNRIHLYAKGLVELGNNVLIIIPRHTETKGKIKNRDTKGEYEGVKFNYACNPIKNKTFIGRRIQNFVAPFNSLSLLYNHKPDIILIVGNSMKYTLLGKICSLVSKAKLVREKSEVPFYWVEKPSYFRNLRSKIEFSLFDGLIVISEELKSFFLNDLSLKLKILEVPILVNIPSKKIKRNGIDNIKPNLVYTGSLLNNKDGILCIIKAFANISENNSNLKLILTGDIDKSTDKERILALINKLNLKEKIELTGYITEEKLHELTSTSTALILAKPENRQNRYNMATKIGEYLFTGRPAVVSAVDPVCNYLSHKKNILIAEPTENQIAKEVQYLLNNSKKADLIGLAGKKTAINLFNYKIHTKRINSFLNELLISN